MSSDNAEQWGDLFLDNLLPLIFALVRDSWEHIAKPTSDENENDTSLRLYSAMVRSKDRQKHPFLIRPEDSEIDAERVETKGRKDIVFYPSNDEDIYFCLEAKRLNALVSNRIRSLATEYVEDGMQRFIDGKYSRRVYHGGMLGYVLDGNVDDAMTKVATAIRNHHQTLGMVPPGKMLNSSVRPEDAYVKETHHSRNNEATAFQIHHLFASGQEGAME